MRVLITGGYGFIGSCVAERFFNEGHEIYIIDDLSSGKKENVSCSHKYYPLQIEDPKCEEIFRSGRFDIVIHLAAKNDMDNSIDQPESITKANILGLTNMLHLAQKYNVKKFIFTSSTAVYGSNPKIHIKEEEPCTPISPYGVSKYVGEIYCQQWQKQYSLDTLIFRLTHVYGPKQGNRGEGQVISQLINRICEGEKLLIYGDGEQTYDFIYVEDVADAIYRSALTDLSGVYNLSSQTETSMNDLIHSIEKMTKIPEVEYLEKLPKELHYSSINNSLLKRKLDWVPLYSIEEGLEKTLKWFQKHSQNTIQIEKKKKSTRLSFTPLVENLIGFIIVILLTLNKNSILENIFMDYNIIYILLFGMIYGTRQSLISVFLSTILMISLKITNGRETVSLFYDTQVLFTISSYLFIGLVSGFTTDKRRQEQEGLKSQIETLKEKHSLLNEVFQDTCTIKDRLQEQILRNRDGIGRIHHITTRLNHLEPEIVLNSAISVLEELMESNSISIYSIESYGEIHSLIHSRGLYTRLLTQSSLSEYPEIKRILETKDIYVNRTLAQNMPAMVAPIFNNSEIIGFIMIEKMEFENFTLFNENLFKVSVDLINRFLSRAYHYVAITRNIRHVEGTTILSEPMMKIIIESKNEAKYRHHVSYELLRVVQVNDSLRHTAELVKGIIRRIDYIGYLNEELFILLSNPLPEEVEKIKIELERLGIYVIAVGEMTHKEEVGKLVYV